MPIAQSIPTRRIYVSPVLVFVRPDEFCTPKTELNIYFYIVRKRFLYVKSHLIYGNPESSTLRIVSRGSNFKMFSKLRPRGLAPLRRRRIEVHPPPPNFLVTNGSKGQNYTGVISPSLDPLRTFGCPFGRTEAVCRSAKGHRKGSGGWECASAAAAAGGAQVGPRSGS